MKALFALLLALSAAIAMAADVTGKWAGETAGPNGTFPLKFDFKQSGAKLTGTVEGPQGDPIPISGGKVEGDNITFSITFDGGGGQMKITHSGKVNDDEITLTAKFDSGGPGGDGPGPISLKRAK